MAETEVSVSSEDTTEEVKVVKKVKKKPVEVKVSKKHSTKATRGTLDKV